jgi:ABC-type xylose transport system substrate-binding protein
MKRIRIEMTGSPKPFGFKTKEQFMDALIPFGVSATKITHGPDFLVTNSMESETLKMKSARERGIEVMTYGDMIKKYRMEMRLKKLQELKEKIGKP